MPAAGHAPASGNRPLRLIAILAASAGVLLVTASVIVVTTLDGPRRSGSDPFAGAYPLVKVAPTSTGEPAPTWQPTGRAAGPLRRFPGTPTRVTGRIVDKKAGLSYARLSRPYRRLGVGSHTGGQEFDSNGENLQTYWYCAVYSSPLDPDFAPAVKAAGRSNAMRAAAELEAKDALKLYDTAKRTDIAGQPLSVAGRRAWLTALRLDHPKGSRNADQWTMVFVAVDTGRAVPGIAEIHVPNTVRRLPDINTIVRSLRVAR